MNRTQIFRELHANPSQLLILPNIWDAAGARLIESLGAKAVATSSGGFAWAKGYADGNRLPVRLQAQLAEEIVNAVKIPVSVDFETGYSDDPATVAENLKPLLDAGISGINLEDGTDAPALLAKKIEAIKSAGGDVFINARADVYLRNLVPDDKKLQETLARAATYRAAGADGFFVPGASKAADIAAIVEGTDLPLNLLSLPPVPKAEELTKLGVRRLSAGSAPALAAYQHLARVAESFLKEGDFAAFRENTMTYPQFQELFRQ